MIQASVIFYNDTPELLEACLSSLHGKVDTIITIDGPFKDFTHKSILSTDGCLEIAKKYSNKVITAKKAWESQIEKRNAYLTLKNENDIYFIIDADEVYEGESLKQLIKSDYAINVFTPSSNLDNKQIRIFKHRQDICYAQRHSWVWSQGDIINSIDSFPEIKFLLSGKIIHNSHLRPIIRLQDDLKYMAKRKEVETPPARAVDKKKIEAKSIKLERVAAESYSGFDPGFSRSIEALQGQIVEVSILRAGMLLADFPADWKKV